MPRKKPPHPEYRPRRGHYCVVEIIPHDLTPKSYAVRRIVRVNHKGFITHVCREWEWQRPGDGNMSANGTNALKYQWVRQTFTLSKHHDNPALARLAGNLEDLDKPPVHMTDIADIKAAILAAVA